MFEAINVWMGYLKYFRCHLWRMVCSVKSITAECLYFNV